jgi:hypothetical protein
VLPDWSPSKIYNGYYPGSNNLKLSGTKSGTNGKADATSSQNEVTSKVHCCAGSCNIHGHNHNVARESNIPVSNYTGFWGTLGCSCFAF